MKKTRHIGIRPIDQGMAQGKIDNTKVRTEGGCANPIETYEIVNNNCANSNVDLSRVNFETDVQDSIG